MIEITEHLIKAIETQGVVLADREYTKAALDKALLDGCFSFIEHDGRQIGFVTWVLRPKEIYLENMLIYKGFRGIFNVLKLRTMLREKYGSVHSLSWKNRKQQREKKFIQKERVLCSQF